MFVFANSLPIQISAPIAIIETADFFCSMESLYPKKKKKIIYVIVG